MTTVTFTTELSTTADHKEFLLVQRALNAAVADAGLTASSQASLNDKGDSVSVIVEDQRDVLEITRDFQNAMNEVFLSSTSVSVVEGNDTLSHVLPVDV